MSSPLIWIILPGLIAIGLFPLGRYPRLSHAVGTTSVLLLLLLAFRLPINVPIPMGVPNLRPLFISDTLVVLGRRFILDDLHRPFLALIYLIGCLWFTGSFAAGVDALFMPLGLGIISLITASIAIEPALFSALFLALAALICVPIFSPPGKSGHLGILRFLTFQMIGMGLFLFADWFFSVSQFQPEDQRRLMLAVVSLGLGFAFMAGIFPFHTWIPMLAETTHPYAASFVMFFLPLAVAFTGLNYLNLLTPLAIFPTIQSTLRLVGVSMVLIGGIWAAMERHLGRIMGFAIMVVIGMATLAISLTGYTRLDTPLVTIFFTLLVPQACALVVWSQALSSLMRDSEGDSASLLRYYQQQGAIAKHPIASTCLVLANFSLAGLPLLASFPADIALWSSLAEISLPIALLSLVGNAGLLVAGLRTLAVLIIPTEEHRWHISEKFDQAFWLTAGLAVLLIMGLLPGWYFPALLRLGTLALPNAP